MTNPSLEKEYAWFQESRNQLALSHPKQYAVIADQSVLGVYSTHKEAYFQARRKRELGSFIIQQCVREEDEQPRIFFHSQV